MHATQEHVQEVLGPHHRYLCGMYERAWELYTTIPAELRAVFGQSNRTVAANIWSLATYEAIRYFIPLGFVPRVRHGTVEFPMGQHIVLRFKKTDSKGGTRNYATSRAVRYDAGLPLPDVPEVLRVNVGWLPNGNGTGIQDVLISLRGPVAWCYSISINSAGNVDLFEFAQDDEAGPLIRPRYDQDRTDADEESAEGA